MNASNNGRDLSSLDLRTLEKITRIAFQARGALLAGISEIRQMNRAPKPTNPIDTQSMLEQLGRLTLMWDEIHLHASRMMVETTVPEFPEIEAAPLEITYH